MKRFGSTREALLVLATGIAAAWPLVVGGQQRHGGGGVPAYHPAPSYRPQAPAYQGNRPSATEGYRGSTGQPAYGRQQPMMAERYGQEQQAPAPVERRPPGGQPYQQQPYRGQMPQAGPARQQGQGLRGEHLAEWMNQHRNLTPEQQQQALQREPGFNQLPQQTQDRMRNRLAQLNAMPPEQRQRILSYNERMEHLSVNQREEVRGSLQQLGALPVEQRRQVAQSFRELRALPPSERGAALNSPQYQSMSPAQRSALNNLLKVEPLLPPSEQQAPR